eukprot:10546283-Alexandrium_andersonii.AAC.1
MGGTARFCSAWTVAVPKKLSWDCKGRADARGLRVPGCTAAERNPASEGQDAAGLKCKLDR